MEFAKMANLFFHPEMEFAKMANLFFHPEMQFAKMANLFFRHQKKLAKIRKIKIQNQCYNYLQDRFLLINHRYIKTKDNFKNSKKK